MGISLPQIISTEVGRLLIPLKELDTPSEMGQYVRELGLDFTSIASNLNIGSLASEVDTLITKITALISARTNEARLDATVELVEQIIVVVNTFKTEIPNIQAALNNISGENTANFAEEFFKRAIDNLVFTYLQDYLAPVFGILYTIKLTDEATDSQSNLRYKKIYWNNLGKLFSSPVDLFNTAYDWDSNFKQEEFLRRFALMLSAMNIPGGIYPQNDPVKTNLGRGNESNPTEIRIPLMQRGTWGSNWQEIDLNLSPIPQDGTKLPGILLYPYFIGNATVDIDLSENWELILTGGTEIGGGLGIEIRPNEPVALKTDLFSTPQNSSSVSLSLAARYRQASGENILLGSKRGSYLSSSTFELITSVEKSGSDGDVKVELQMGTIKLVIATGNADGFLQKILPNGFELEFGFGVGYSLENGFYFAGGSGLAFFIDLHLALGPIGIQGLSVGLAPADDGLKLDLGTNLKLELGPFQAVVEQIGMRNELSFPEGGGQFGPLDYHVGFKPPKGVGLTLDAGAVKGGGYLFFDYEEESYAGVVELSVQDTIALKAIGLLTTRFEDGSKGFSLLLLITAEFTPIQLGFGFTLNGVGGLIGVNRTMVLEALQEGVRTGAIDHILFPRDPIANAPQIISDLQAIFPPEEGRYAFGLMGKVGWGIPSILELEMGLIIEVPNPIRLAIIGVIRAILPEENLAILKLQVNFAGTIDFEKKFITFDARLFDSKLLTWTLSGDMAVRIKGGNNPNFVFTVGGFHPNYTPPPLGLPTLKRLSISLLSGKSPRLTIETYFALTSNTVQMGARVDFYFKVVGSIHVKGWLGFDALLQFSPFYFIVSFSAGLGVYKGRSSIMGISLTVTLEGPTPWHAKGTASFKILFFRFRVRFDKSWGRRDNTSLPDKQVMPELIAALQHPGNWNAVGLRGSQTNVSMRTIEGVGIDRLILRPDSLLSVRQKVVPLDMVIEKFGNHKPSDYDHFEIELLDSDGQEITGADLKEQFAPNNFFSLTNEQKLSRPNFEQYNAGVNAEIAGDGQLASDHFSERQVIYEHSLMDDRSTPIVMPSELLRDDLFNTWVLGGSAARSALGTVSTGTSVLAPDPVRVTEDTFVLVNTSKMEVVAESLATSFFEAEANLLTILSNKPELIDELEIIPSYELN